MLPSLSEKLTSIFPQHELNSWIDPHFQIAGPLVQWAQVGDRLVLQWLCKNDRQRCLSQLWYSSYWWEQDEYTSPPHSGPLNWPGNARSSASRPRGFMQSRSLFIQNTSTAQDQSHGQHSVNSQRDVIM